MNFPNSRCLSAKPVRNFLKKLREYEGDLIRAIIDGQRGQIHDADEKSAGGSQGTRDNDVHIFEKQREDSHFKERRFSFPSFVAILLPERAQKASQE